VVAEAPLGADELTLWQVVDRAELERLWQHARLRLGGR